MTGPATEAIHVPVMVAEVVTWLVTAPRGWYVDGTVGTGGHAEAILAQLSSEGNLLGLDLDPRTLAIARTRLSASAARVVLRQDSHARLPEVLSELRVEQCQGLLLDLGLSSLLLSGGGRGFSFQTDETLDMRYDPTRGEPLHHLLRELSPGPLAGILRRYGEERHASRIAAGIHREAVAGRLTTSGALAATVRAVIRGPHVTKTLARVFQALRIFVNDELRTLETTLGHLSGLLAQGRRVVILSYHSLEDRMVKQFFARESKDCICPPEQPQCTCEHTATLKVLTRKPVTPSTDEVAANRRSRSAKLRVAERL